MKPHSRATPFQNTYFIDYGLRVVTRDVNTHKVQSVECLFCVYFGRTPSIPDTCQRKLTSRIKSWTAPWHAELSQSIMSVSIYLNGWSTNQHPSMTNAFSSTIKRNLKIRYTMRLEMAKTLLYLKLILRLYKRLSATCSSILTIMVASAGNEPSSYSRVKQPRMNSQLRLKSLRSFI